MSAAGGQIAFVESTRRTKRGLAEMLKGGVIMDVINADQAKLAQEAGAVAVMALERVPSDIRASGGVARMADPGLIKEIQKSVSIPVMAKVRIGHFVEAEILESLAVDYIDESEVLTPADEQYHICKDDFKVPFVCGCRDLGEALRRISEGAAFMRTKGEAGTGNIVQAVRHLRNLKTEMDQLGRLDGHGLIQWSHNNRVPLTLVEQVAESGTLPVVNFAAGGVATPADAALCMRLGANGIFVGSGIFKSSNPTKLARAIVNAVTHFEDKAILERESTDVGTPMTGIGETPDIQFAKRESQPAAKSRQV